MIRKQVRETKKSFVPVKDGREEQNKAKEVINVDKEVVNVDDNDEEAHRKNMKTKKKKTDKGKAPEITLSQHLS
jgi:competence protein ComGF